MPRFSFDFNTKDMKHGTFSQNLCPELSFGVTIKHGIPCIILSPSYELNRKRFKEFSASIELKILGSDSELWERKFFRTVPKEAEGMFIDLNSEIYDIPRKPRRCYGHVEITASRHNDIENVKATKLIQQKCLDTLLIDYQRLLDPKTSSFTDVTLKCGDVSMPAHRCILSARSPVFATMFANKMKESIKKELVITDIDLPTLCALLLYMYTGQTDFTATSATDLVFAAEKYHLPDLKAACTHFLKCTVSLQNVSKILVLGDMLDEDLKSFAMDYICKKRAEFSVLEDTDEWKTLRDEKPALVNQVLTSVVKSVK